jgi:hypothetical protein
VVIKAKQMVSTMKEGRKGEIGKDLKDCSQRADNNIRGSNLAAVTCTTVQVSKLPY